MVFLLISLIFRQNQTTRRKGKEPGFTLVAKKKASRKARTATTGRPGSRGTVDPSSGPSRPESAPKTSGSKAGAGPLGKAASAGTEATAAEAAVT